MYRKAGSTSVLCGVPSGAYSGGKRVIDAARLDAATRERLDKALALRGHPAPIAYERPAAHASSKPVWGIIAATMGLSTVFAVGFGNLDSDWATQPWWSLAVYLALGLFFAWSLLPLLRRRALFGGGARGALRPGRYLFPLDAFEIDLPDASGRQRITVYPLGNARHSDVAINGKRVDLLLRFEGGEQLEFPLRGDHKGTVALRRLEHAQHLLEDLTYNNRLEEAFANDLFFDLRVENSWDRHRPETGPAPVRAPNAVSLVLGRFAPALLAVVTIGLGAGTFFVRREAGDTALYNHALALGTPQAMDRYLARGGRRRLAAEDVKFRLVEAEKTRREREEYSRRTEQAFGAGFREFDSAEEEAADLKCIEALRARASSTHPKSVPALVQLVKLKTRRFELHLGRIVDREPELRSAEVPDLDAELTARDRVFEGAFAHVLSEICPSSVLAVSPDMYELSYLHVAVHVKVVWLARTWKLTDADGKPFEAHPLRFDFHVELVRPRETLESFDLSVAPPPEPLMAVRPQSLFVLAGDPPEPGVFDKRVYSAMTARAYDRLYDELWSLFFAGDPRVPLVPAPGVAPWPSPGGP
jgi:hypothetical protein